MAELEDERLPIPGPLDREERLEPVGLYRGRPIPTAGLVVLYVITSDGAVLLVAVKRTA